MARIAILFGILMVVLSACLYPAAVVRSMNGDPPLEANAALVKALTALIPAGFGIVLILLGAIATNGSDSTRKHTMHVAALIGLLGVVLPMWRIIKALTAEGALDPLPVGGNVGMVVLSAIFLALCVKSFIDARVARKQREAEAAAASGR